MLPRVGGPWPVFFPALSLHLLPGQQSLQLEATAGSLLRGPRLPSDRVPSNQTARKTDWSRGRRERFFFHGEIPTVRQRKKWESFKEANMVTWGNFCSAQILNGRG